MLAGSILVLNGLPKSIECLPQILAQAVSLKLVRPSFFYFSRTKKLTVTLVANWYSSFIQSTSERCDPSEKSCIVILSDVGDMAFNCLAVSLAQAGSAFSLFTASIISSMVSCLKHLRRQLVTYCIVMCSASYLLMASRIPPPNVNGFSWSILAEKLSMILFISVSFTAPLLLDANSFRLACKSFILLDGT